MSVRLSAHFTLAELTRSATAERLGIDNTPDVDAIRNLSRLTIELLEPIRALLWVPIVVDSGYRSAAVNGSIPEKGTTHSAHLDGRAADIVPKGVAFRAAFDEIRLSDIPYDQLILESGAIHVAIAREGETPRRQALIRSGTAPDWIYTEV